MGRSGRQNLLYRTKKSHPPLVKLLYSPLKFGFNSEFSDINIIGGKKE